MSDMGNFYGVGPVNMKEISFATVDSGAANLPEVGTRRIYKGEEYVFVHNAMSATQLDMGELLTTSALSGYSLTNSTTAAADLPLASVKHVTIPTGGYGWALVRGINEVLKVATTMATGAVVGVGANGVGGVHVGGSFSTGPAIGKVLSSGSSTVKAYLKLYG